MKKLISLLALSLIMATTTHAGELTLNIKFDWSESHTLRTSLNRPENQTKSFCMNIVIHLSNPALTQDDALRIVNYLTNEINKKINELRMLYAQAQRAQEARYNNYNDNDYIDMINKAVAAHKNELMLSFQQ